MMWGFYLVEVLGFWRIWQVSGSWEIVTMAALLNVMGFVHGLVSTRQRDRVARFERLERSQD